MSKKKPYLTFIFLLLWIPLSALGASCLSQNYSKLVKGEYLLEGPRISYSPPLHTELRRLNEIQELQIGQYNTLNLYSPRNYNRLKRINAESPGGIRIKNRQRIKALGETIKKADNDIIILNEVVGLESLENLSRFQLDNAYQALLVPGNDPRGIDIGVLIKRDLPLQFHLQSHKHRQQRPLFKSWESVFARDFVVLEVRPLGATESSEPILLIGGAHLKSQRAEYMDSSGIYKRLDETREIVKIMRSFKESYPRTPQIIAADFNNQIGKKTQTIEFDPLWKGAWQDSFDLTRYPQGRATFYPREGLEPQQLDAILVDQQAAEASLVTHSRIIPFYDHQGKLIPPVKTPLERRRRASDHRMISLEIDFQKLLGIFK